MLKKASTNNIHSSLIQAPHVVFVSGRTNLSQYKNQGLKNSSVSFKVMHSVQKSHTSVCGGPSLLKIDVESDSSDSGVVFSADGYTWKLAISQILVIPDRFAETDVHDNFVDQSPG